MTSCENGCCKYEIREYKKCSFQPRTKQKAGVFIYDSVTHKVLLVQSRGNLWGPPKGSLEINETYSECAIREVFEETGICLQNNDIADNNKFIFNNSHYFYCELQETPVTLDSPMSNSDVNDASGIGWFRIECLIKLIKNKTININFHCRLLLEYFLKISLH